MEIIVKTLDPSLHEPQLRMVNSKAKRLIVKAGRRGGKTAGASIKAVDAFVDGRRVLYAAPTSEQTDKFWYETTRALSKAVLGKVYKQNDSEKFIEREGTQNRIKAKTAWNANTLRGDYADLLIFDEFQLTAEDAWDEVGAPMLLDNNGDAVFIFTPASLKASGISKAKDPRHASKLFKKAQADKTGLWEAIHFTSHDNPYISKDALVLITQDMSRDSYLKEIMAEDDDDQLDLLVYGCFNENICKIQRFEIPKHWVIYTGHDFGSANPAALFVAQDPGTGFFYCFKEYIPATGKSTFENVQEFKRMAALPGEVGETPKLYNILQRVGGNVTTEDEIRQGYAVQGWPITAPYITKVNAQVDRVKQLMEKNKVFVFSDMYHLLEEINTCIWKLDTFGKRSDEIKDEKRYHLLACVRYLFSIFQPEVEQKTKGGMVMVGW